MEKCECEKLKKKVAELTKDYSDCITDRARIYNAGAQCMIERDALQKEVTELRNKLEVAVAAL